MVSIDSMRWTLLCSLAVATTGCFSPDVPLDTDGPESGTDGLETESASGQATDSNSGTGTSNGPGGTMESGDPTTDGETDPSGDTDPAGDEPPQIESFSVNDSQTPEDVTQSSLVRLSAEVSDDVGVASVEFFDGEMSVGTATEAPYEVEVLVTSSDSGGHVYTARATDTVDQEATSDEVQLFVDVTGGEIVDINEGLLEGCVTVGQFGGIAVVSDDRFAISATGCDLNSTALLFDSSLEVVSSDVLEGIARPPTTTGDGLVVVPTGALVGGMPVWHYNVFDPQLGNVDAGAGLLFSGVGQAVPAAEVLPSGVFVARSATEVAVLEPDFDADIWVDDLGLGGEDGVIGSTTTDEFGNLFIHLGSDACPGSADNCLLKYDPSGAREWTRGTQSGTFYGGLAPSGDGGVFDASFTDTGFLVGRRNEDGDEVASQLLTFAEDRSTFPRITADGQGGLVLVAAYGAIDNMGQVPEDESVMLRLDRNLETLWEVTDLGPGQSRAVALRSDSLGRLLVVGLEFAEASPTLFASEGLTWVAAVNL